MKIDLTYSFQSRVSIFKIKTLKRVNKNRFRLSVVGFQLFK